MRIEVEPQALIGGGKQMGSLGSQLGMLSDALAQTLGSGIASGTDPAGLNFGLKYGRQGDEFGKALADAANAFKSVGYALEATGYNYQNADASSTIGGSGPTGGLGGEPGKTNPGDAPTGPTGAPVTPPTKWYLIQPFLTLIPGLGIAMAWPTGNSGMMNVTAAQWSNISRGLSVFESALGPVKSAVAAQSIPEGGQITKALDDLGTAVAGLSSAASDVATSISEFAAGVQETQDSIRRLLDRISIDGLWDTVTGFLSGDGDKILREVAEDVGNVLENFQSQIKGLVGLLDELTIAIGDLATKFQNWIRPVLVGVFGEEHGNLLADAVTLYTDIQVGVATGLIGTVSGLVALADVDTWKGMGELALSVVQDPSTLDDVLLNMGKDFVAWDKWSGDHPGRAAGEAAFNIGSLFVPGGALSKSGSVAKGLAATRNLLKGGSHGSHGGLPEVNGANTPNLPHTPDVPNVPNVPELSPSPGIPESVLTPNGSGGPSAPGNAGDAPVHPQSSQPNGASGPSGQGAPVGTPSGGGDGASGSSGSSPNGSGPVPTGGSPSGGGGEGPGSSSPGNSPSAVSPDSYGQAQSPSAPAQSGEGSGHNSGSPSESGGGSSPSGSPSTPNGSPDSGGSRGDLGPTRSDLEPPSPAGEQPGDSPAHSVEDASGAAADSDLGQDPSEGADSGADGPGLFDDNAEPGAPISASDRFPDASPYGDLSKDQFDQQFVDDNGELIYPDEHDPNKPYAVPGTIRVLTPDEIRSTLDGSVLDRIGHPGGKWLAPEGADYGERALPPSSLEKDYYRYQVNVDNPLPPGWTIEESRVAPWFGHPGGGLQYKIIAPAGERPNVLELLETGFLEPM